MSLLDMDSKLWNVRETSSRCQAGLLHPHYAPFVWAGFSFLTCQTIRCSQKDRNLRWPLDPDVILILYRCEEHIASIWCCFEGADGQHGRNTRASHEFSFWIMHWVSYSILCQSHAELYLQRAGALPCGARSHCTNHVWRSFRVEVVWYGDDFWASAQGSLQLELHADTICVSSCFFAEDAKLRSVFSLHDTGQLFWWHTTRAQQSVWCPLCCCTCLWAWSTRLLSNIFPFLIVVCEKLWHPSVLKLYLVDHDQSVLGTLYCDLFHREGKQNHPTHYTIQSAKVSPDMYQKPVVALVGIKHVLDHKSIQNDCW